MNNKSSMLVTTEEAINIRNAYFNSTKPSYSEEEIIFWKKVAMVCRVAGVTSDQFIQAQLEYFSKKNIEKKSEFGLSLLITDSAIKRAKAFKEESIDTSSVTNMEAYKARNTFVSYNSVYYPNSRLKVQGDLDVWKQTVLQSKLAKTDIESFILAQFKWAKSKNWKILYPTALVRPSAIKVSLTVNQTIL